MTTSFNNLPEELIEKTFLHTTDNSQANLLPQVLGVCGLWNRLAKPLLWTNIRLDEKSLCRFVTLSEYNPDIGLVENLTILPDARALAACCPVQDGEWNIHISYRTAPYIMKSLSFGLSRLSKRLPLMRKLRTFSMNFLTAPMPYRDYGIWIYPITLRSILQSMPPSLENLELDTRGYDRFGYHGDMVCSCDLIAKLLPQLKHIKLSLASMCSKVFAPSNSIESIVINLADGLGCMTVLCGSQWDQYTVDMDMHQKHHDGLIVRDALLNAGSDLALQMTHFPQLKSFQIIDVDSLDSVFLKHDLLAQTTISYPSLDLSDPNPQLGHCHFLIRVKDSPISQCLDLVASMPNIVSYLSGHIWIEDVQGRRHPACARTQPRTKLLKWKILPRPNTGIIWRPGHQCLPRVHRLEMRLGRTLFRPRARPLGQSNPGCDLEDHTMCTLELLPPHSLYAIVQMKLSDDELDKMMSNPNATTALTAPTLNPPLLDHQNILQTQTQTQHHPAVDVYEPDLTHNRDDYTDGVLSISDYGSEASESDAGDDKSDQEA